MNKCTSLVPCEVNPQQRDERFTNPMDRPSNLNEPRKKQTTPTFQYTSWLVGILTVVYDNPYKLGRFSSPI